MKKDKRYIVYAFVLNLTLGLILVLIGFIMGEGVFYLGTDFNFQQIPFNTFARQCIESGKVFWLDNFDLGTSFIGALSFYVIGSPFFWLSFIIPNPNYALIIPCMLVLKFAVAGTGAYCYSKQYIKSHNWALIASMLYAFSGYQLANINYNHFHDITALFPFLLLALDRAVKENKKGAFAVMVALCALTNYFFFAAEVIFLIIYFSVMVFSGEYKIDVKLFLSLAAESLIGVGIAMILLLPNVFFILENPRVSQSVFSLPLSQQLFLKPYQYADLLRAMLIPAESIFNRGIVMDFNPTAAELYLPVIGFIGVFGFMIKNKKHWMSVLSVICFVFMCNTVLNSSFTLFNSEYYARWLFMPLLIFSVMTAKYFENGQDIKTGFKGLGVVLALFVAARLMWKYYFHVEFWPNRLLAFIMISLALCGLAVTVFIYIFRNKKITYYILLSAIFVQVAISYSINTYYTHKHWNAGYQTAAEYFYSDPNLKYPNDDEYYRTDTKSIFANAGILTGIPSINTFTSNISGSIFEFYQANNMSRAVNSLMNRDYRGFYSMLGVKYIIMPKGQVPETPGFTRQPVHTDLDYDFYENTNFIGMGFAYENAISQREYAKLSPDVKHLAAMDTIVLTDEDMSVYGGMFNIKTAADYEEMNYDTMLLSVEEKAATSAQNFVFEKSVYSFDTTTEKDTVYYVSVPYDKGFTAYVNGEEAQIIKVNNGFTGIVMPAGENSVQLAYFPQGLKAGAVISGISILMLCGYLRINKKRKI